MKTVLRLISYVGLVVMFGAAVMLFNGALPVEKYHVAALIGTALWFVTVPFWMKRRLHQSE